MVSLLNLPDVALSKLLEKCDYLSIQALRKTCWNFRNFINTTNPTPLYQLTIHRKVDAFEMEFYSKNHQGKHAANVRVTLKKVRKGCHMTLIKNDGITKRFLKNKDFSEMFFTDYALVANNPNLILEEFDISSNQPGCESVIERMKQSNPIRTKKFGMGFDECSQLKELLSLVSPDHLEEITVSKTNSFVFSLSLENVFEMDQWKNVKKLNLLCFIFDSSIQFLSPFDEVSAQIKEPNEEILNSLKTIFINSRTEKQFQFTFTHNDLDVYLELLGQPFIDGNAIENWFFKSTVTDSYFCIQLSEKLVFKHIDEKDVPTWAEVKVE
ncbi:hypothetical protein CAEBREN_04887 [Caenorhabditis brenneri]|uniref:F-box domain-containing protein n=1 Tax=Caenorhabditis brenneri TaxID=135651 RepID=G0NMY8_CAEBE|nr:hypothetical protein CAEBREN_04887 [Caenorhabditis brenneri]